MRRSWLLGMCVLLSSTLLSGMPSLVSAKKLEPSAQLSATHGYVYVNFPKGYVSNVGATSGMIGMVAAGNVASTPMSVVRVGGNDEVALEPRKGEEHEGAYGAWLPAGEYRIARWNGESWGEQTRFEVQAGRVTDLGNLVPVDIGAYQIMLLPTQVVAMRSDGVDLALKEFASFLTQPEPLRWAPATLPPPIQQTSPYGYQGLIGAYVNKRIWDRNRPDSVAQLQEATSPAEFLRRLKQITPPLGIGKLDADGTTYFPADYGVVRVRSTDGTWRSLETGGLARINSVAVHAGVLVAGTGDGDVLRSVDAGATWTRVAHMEDEPVIDVSYVADRWFVATNGFVRNDKGVLVSDSIKVYTATESLADLALLRALTIGKMKGLGFYTGRGAGTTGSYYVNLNDGLYRYAVAAQQWTKMAIAAKHITSFRIDSTAKVVTAFVMGGFSGRTYVSHDDGATWKERERPFLGYADAMFDADDSGHAFRIEFGPQTERWELHTYDHATGKWTRVNFLPIRCRPMRTGAGVPAMCVTTGMDVYALKDGKWVVDFNAE